MIICEIIVHLLVIVQNILLVNLAQQERKKNYLKNNREKYKLVIDELPKFRVFLEYPFVLKDNVFAVEVSLRISVSSCENKCTDARWPPM